MGTKGENVKVLLKLQNVLVEEVSLIGKDSTTLSFGRVWLTRFQARNALDSQTLQDIVDTFNYLQTQFHLNVVVLAGRGESFCSGADLKEKADQSKSGREKRYNIQLGRRAIAAIENLEAITIARVHGHAAGGGFGLMQACDLRIVVENTRLWLPEVDIKLPLTWGLTARLIRDVGRAKAMELIAMGTDLAVRDAYRLGLVNRIAKDEEELDATVREWLAVLGTKNKSTLHFIKTQFRQLDIMVDLGRATDTDNDYLLYNRLLDASL
eukprot:CAMPEP_0204873004 /NCGR_PEP_ID=MMETSP1348-20121228/39460_1 /ASSEMBLY_ACC=CAM_ASM_000700 /TAXON_ID=215587 /ORGANISM="Aplanochytrium stocchinoi, Strain GSBS06" /LENGTH=266 /DNA_ID=CAMNT_0052028111 /DNA_START=48 /DNA_END=848 /DNA_ORIENTATION=+